MSYEIILFDADDTLFDYTAAEGYALSHAFQQHELACDDDVIESYRRINQQLWNELEQGLITIDALRVERFTRLWAEHSMSVAVHPNDFSADYLRHLSAGAFLIDGAVVLCNELLAKGYRLAVITNGFKEVQFGRIGRSELSDAFEHIIVSEDAGVQKPSAGIFDYAFDKLNIRDKSKVLIVGDSLSSDIRGGFLYGIDTCWFNPAGKLNTTDIQPTYEISKLSELIAILREKKV